MRWHQVIARLIVQQPNEQVGHCSFRSLRAVRAVIRQLPLHRIPQRRVNDGSILVCQVPSLAALCSATLTGCLMRDGCEEGRRSVGGQARGR